VLHVRWIMLQAHHFASVLYGVDSSPAVHRNANLASWLCGLAQLSLFASTCINSMQVAEHSANIHCMLMPFLLPMGPVTILH
jgi:hypothetical protein